MVPFLSVRKLTSAIFDSFINQPVKETIKCGILFILRNFVGTPAANFGDPGVWHTVEIKQVPFPEYFNEPYFGILSLSLNGFMVFISVNRVSRDRGNLLLYLGDEQYGNANSKVKNILIEKANNLEYDALSGYAVFPAKFELDDDEFYLIEQEHRTFFTQNAVLKNDGTFNTVPYGTYDDTYDNYLIFISENYPDLWDISSRPDHIVLPVASTGTSVETNNYIVRNQFYDFKLADSGNIDDSLSEYVPLATAVCCGITFQKCGTNPSSSFDYNEDEAAWDATLNADESKCNALDVSTGKPHVWKVLYPR